MEQYLHILSENGFQSRILYLVKLFIIKFESTIKIVLDIKGRSQKFTFHTLSQKVHHHIKKVYQETGDM